MSSGSDHALPKRRRGWWILLGMALGLMLATVVGTWVWLEADGDIRAIESEMHAAGLHDRDSSRAEAEDPARLALALRIDGMVRAVGIPRSIEWKSDIPLREDFILRHREIDSAGISTIARATVDLGARPIFLRPGVGLYRGGWWTLLHQRILVAESEELDLCLAACRTLIEANLQDRPNWWRWQYLGDLCKVMVYRRSDHQEQLLPIAEWLNDMAGRMLETYPLVAERVLWEDCNTLRHSGEMFLKERGALLPQWMANNAGMAIGMRVERGPILRAEWEWCQFLKANPMQPRVWMHEAVSRVVIIAGKSWLVQGNGFEVLYLQHPLLIESMVKSVITAQVLAADLRGSPWPIDVLDPMGSPLRRWEVDGHLVGAYSVGPDGVDDGGDPRKDIRVHLFPEPASAPAP